MPWGQASVSSPAIFRRTANSSRAPDSPSSVAMSPTSLACSNSSSPTNPFAPPLPVSDSNGSATTISGLNSQPKSSAPTTTSLDGSNLPHLSTSLPPSQPSPST